MGDAGPAIPASALLDDARRRIDVPRRREVTVLVTGFGPFKSFAINPSFLIASKLAPFLYPRRPQPSDQTSAGAAQPLHSLEDPTVKIVVHPDPVRVSYTGASRLYPDLIAQYGDPDFIVHFGVAGGRDHFALETLARRDGYVIKDVDDRDGRLAGEARWKAAGLPDVLRVGWNAEDVLLRWRKNLILDGVGPGELGGKELVRMSTDAGKFLCEFLLFESLALRAVEDAESQAGKKGKVAFLHVPGPVDRESVARGVKVAEAAIWSLVASWDAGHRAEGFAQ